MGLLFSMSAGQFLLVTFTGGRGAPPTPSDPVPSDASDHGSGTDGDGAVGKEGSEGGRCRNGAVDRRCLRSHKRSWGRVGVIDPNSGFVFFLFSILVQVRTAGP